MTCQYIAWPRPVQRDAPSSAPQPPTSDRGRTNVTGVAGDHMSPIGGDHMSPVCTTTDTANVTFS